MLMKNYGSNYSVNINIIDNKNNIIINNNNNNFNYEYIQSFKIGFKLNEIFVSLKKFS